MADPIPLRYKQAMTSIADAIQATIPPGCGFALLVFDMGDKGRMNYMSNAERSSMIEALKELVANLEAERS